MREQKLETHFADYIISTMPIRDLINAMEENVPNLVTQIANGLMYRGILIVGLLINRNTIKRNLELVKILETTWIYIHEKKLKIGRIQVINNWSPYMVKSDDTIWLGLEYFCNEGNLFWKKKDKEIIRFAINEIQRMVGINRNDIIDTTLLREPNAYPSYFGTYEKLPLIREFTDSFENLYLIGRNGMHEYSSCDYAMLTALKAVENIRKGEKSNDNIWEICNS